MIKVITIVGSRKTPVGILPAMRRIACHCASNGIIVRSGKAEGADAAAIYGCMDAQRLNTLNTVPEMYIPWPCFGGTHMASCWDSVQGNNPYAIQIASALHPAWHRCSQGAKKLHTRNVCQILGAWLDTPSDVVLYWCEEKNGKPTGGTATAVTLAKERNCVTINMLHASWDDVLIPHLQHNGERQ